MEPISIIDDIPEALRGRVALVNGVLHISAELKNNLQIVDFYGSLRRRGILTYEFHKPEEFDNTYQAQAAKTGHAENEIIQYAIDLIKDAFETGASDIHLMDFGLYTIIRFRCLGMLTDHTQLNAELGQRLIACIYQKLSQSADACFSPTERQDGRIAAREYLPPSVHSVRVHSEPIECAQAKEGVGTSMSLRLLYDATSAKGSLLERMTALGFTAGQCDTAQFLTRRTGLTIISGPTGHGKSTFLKHVMESMTERNPEKAYFSIEDPPEYPLKGVRQVLIASNDRGSRSGAYCDAIAGAMRSDPDVLMIGEIRYVEAAVAAIDAALTGHSVWATIHANNAMGIIARLVSILATHYRNPLEQICDHNVLAGLEYQRLLPMLCPECKIRLMDLKPEERQQYLPEDVAGRLRRVLDDRESVYVRGDGCEKCRKRGLIGQTVAAEIVATDQEMLGYLREGNIPRAHEYWLKEKGGRSYVDHAVELIKEGLVDPYLAEERLGVPLNFNQVFVAGGR
ncbi:MAG: ATPase, T2SS/T4P/T4SS family [Desulfovibrio sp.]|nr:ATPase, T2SS/T4P/T4SS family [Oscillospiraceae bacterium]